MTRPTTTSRCACVTPGSTCAGHRSTCECGAGGGHAIGNACGACAYGWQGGKCQTPVCNPVCMGTKSKCKAPFTCDCSNAVGDTCQYCKCGYYRGPLNTEAPQVAAAASQLKLKARLRARALHHHHDNSGPSDCTPVSPFQTPVTSLGCADGSRNSDSSGQLMHCPTFCWDKVPSPFRLDGTCSFYGCVAPSHIRPCDSCSMP